MQLTLTGTGFAQGTSVWIGDQRLANVDVASSTTLVATLPTGMCEGSYPISIASPAGGQVSAGELTVQATRSTGLATAAPGPPTRLTGRSQTLTVPLPSVRIEDSSCADAEWTLVVSVGRLAVPGRPERTLGPQTLRLHGPSVGAPIVVPLQGNAVDEVTIRVPRPAGRDTVTLQVELEARIPANAYAGEYRTTLQVAFRSVER